MESQALSPEAVATIEKVKKLLALAHNNSNENEAQSAMAAAQRMLAAYNLDMALVERHGGKTSSRSNRADKKSGGGLYQWQRDLWKSVSELNFCMYWSIKGVAKGGKYEHRILGRQENVISTELMAEYLQGAIDRIAKEWAADHGCHMFARDAIGYREGMAARICERLSAIRRDKLAEDERRKREAEAAGGAARPGDSQSLVLAEVISGEADLNNDHLRGWEPGTTARNRTEREARWAAENARAAAEHEERKRADAEYRRINPEAWANAQADAARERAAEAAAEAKRSEAYWRREARNAARRKGVTYYAAEKGPRSHTYYAGREAGDRVGLDAQLDNGNKGKLK